MRKFKVKLTKEYEIEIDETKINKRILDNFERYFYDLNQEDDRVKSLANDYCRLRAIVISDKELVKKGSIVTIIGTVGDKKYEVRTKEGVSYTVMKENLEFC